MHKSTAKLSPIPIKEKKSSTYLFRSRFLESSPRFVTAVRTGAPPSPATFYRLSRGNSAATSPRAHKHVAATTKRQPIRHARRARGHRAKDGHGLTQYGIPASL
ncbi:hypothetical protein EVAR_15831_1 [Eumeta japonica]|uniref:Uncharacterized protein n=1 Tax=Eumeta variegata TaxID=151549 RepID=A0A4C1UDW1_EUMVA|nr:hypothetical protein EVAR_15831_1 [Eumeta japonica]